MAMFKQLTLFLGILLVPKLVLASGVEDRQMILHEAILNDSIVGVRNAVDAGALVNFNEQSKSPLLKAVLLRKWKAVDALLNVGAEPNISYLGEKIVHYLIRNRNVKIAQSFIEAGADFSEKINETQDAFTYVSRFNMSVPGTRIRPDFDLLYAMVQHGYHLKKNFENKDLNNNAWYLSILEGGSNHIGFFLIAEQNKD